MRRTWLALATLGICAHAHAAPPKADLRDRDLPAPKQPDPKTLALGDPAADHQWPALAAKNLLSDQDRMELHLTEMSSDLCHRLDRLSHDYFQLRVDPLKKRAHVRLGGGSADSVLLRIDAGIQFDDLTAHVVTEIDLGYHGHTVHFELPRIDVSPDEYHGDYGVQVSMPLFAKKF
ncbi:MAG TPA: hypothetical protein VGM88_06170 [Kofleriaceae bacterium]